MPVSDVIDSRINLVCLQFRLGRPVSRVFVHVCESARVCVSVYKLCLCARLLVLMQVRVVRHCSTSLCFLY